MANVLDTLKKLQEIDSELFRLRREQQHKPLELERARQLLAEEQAKTSAAEARLNASQVQRKEKELELSTAEATVKKMHMQLFQIKTNKEYTAKITEIENIKADQSLVEEKILELYEEGDGIKTEIEKEKQVVAEEEKKYLGEKARIDASIKELEDRIRVFKAQRQQIVPGIEKSSLTRYERILANKEGLAIVPVRDDSCGGCHMHLPPQVINEIKMHDHLVYCETCARIIYLEEDL
jgi:predicted  nucleic acid-binding Zn-ribbon protein